ncbi:Fpg/Nei family DNA glycosylase [Yaniella halotolerans]|uniref:Fpg/Nei family DNA glycosylase n=1 Tax=Yaniella halotolerans TaxID=225453 RepID=UPI0003B46FE4|nr:DNA-formamidopyrimidine glycosylase family protein [Yaniella halotolerans]
MPEGHSIHRIARHFDDVFVTQQLRLASPQGRFVEGAELLNGRRAVASEAYGKHWFLYFDNELVLNVHLGMYGAWTFGGQQHSSIGAPRKIGEQEDHTGGAVELTEPRPTTRVRIIGEHSWADLVGPAICRTLTIAEAQDVIDAIGPDPLRHDADPQRFYDVAAKTRRRIGAVLMDQKVIGGIGNIFRAEGLFRLNLNPHTPTNTLTHETHEAVWQDQVRLLEIGVETGRIITTDAKHRPGVELHDAWPEHANYVYQRQGKPCLVCGDDGIIVEELEARKLYWCTTCQQ